MAADLNVHGCGIRYDGAPPAGCPDPGTHRNYTRVPVKDPVPDLTGKPPQVTADLAGLTAACACGRTLPPESVEVRPEEHDGQRDVIVRIDWYCQDCGGHISWSGQDGPL